jgi:hypothetical protein
MKTRDQFDQEILEGHEYVSSRAGLLRKMMAHHISALRPLLDRVRRDERERAAAKVQGCREEGETDHRTIISRIMYTEEDDE